MRPEPASYPFGRKLSLHEEEKMKMVFGILGLMIGLALPLAGTECTVPSEISNYLKTLIAPEILELFHPCVLNGTWPTMYSLKQEEIFSLRGHPTFEEMYVSLNEIDPQRLTSVQKEILRTWVKAGARVYVSCNVQEWLEDVFRVAKCESIGSYYHLSDKEHEVELSDIISFDIQEITVFPKHRAIKSTEHEVVTLIKVIHRGYKYPVMGILRLGCGLIVYNFLGRGLKPYANLDEWLYELEKCFAKPDGARLLLNIRQWLSGLKVPEKTSTFVLPQPNHDLFFMRNGDILSGTLVNRELTFETELYGIRKYDVSQLIYMEYTGDKWFLLYLRDGTRMRVLPLDKSWSLVPLFGEVISVPTSLIEACAFHSGER